MDYKEIKPVEVFGILVKWRRVILFNVVALMLISVVISLVLPKAYTAATTIMPPVGQGASLGLSAMLGVGGGVGFTGMARMAGLPGFGSSSDLFAGLLQTRTLMEEVIHRCNLQDYYGLSLMEETVMALAGATDIAVSFEGMVKVTFTAGSPIMAAKVANTYVDELDRVNRKATMTRGKAARIFIQGRLEEVGRELEAAEESLRVFQERHKTVSLEDEITEAIRAAASLRAKVVARDIQLGILKRFATQDNPQVKKLATEKRELERKLSEMEHGRNPGKSTTSDGFGAGFGVPFSRLPEVGMELVRKIREVEIQNAVYTLLTQQYEEAKIIEARDTPTIQILDVAVPPEKRSFPARKKIVAVGLVLGLLGGLGLGLALEYIERVQSSPDELEGWVRIYKQLYEDLAPLRRNIRKGRKA